ncbi:G patch domain-containing protein 1, partial [Perkinsus olseni]
PSFVLPRIRDININNNPSLPEGTQALLTTLLADLAELRGDAVVGQARLGLPKADTTTIRRLDHLTLQSPLRTSSARQGTSGSSTKSEPDTGGRHVDDDARLAALQEYFPVVRDAISEGDPHDVDEGNMVESQSSGALRSEYMQDLHTLTQRINNKYPTRPKSDVISDLKASSGEEGPTTLPADQTSQYSPSARDGLPRDIMNASCEEGNSLRAGKSYRHYHHPQSIGVFSMVNDSASTDLVVMEEEETTPIPVASTTTSQAAAAAGVVVADDSVVVVAKPVSPSIGTIS